VRAAACAALTGLALAVAATPASAAPPPSVGAKSAIVVDAATGEQLFGRAPDSERAIASTTKLMTALLTLEETKPSDVFAAPAYGGSAAESRINLRKGERMTVGDLTRALMLASANDAAATLAEGIAGSRSAFVEEMNLRAQQIGLTETSYANPIGLDDPDNFSSASDLAALARRLLTNRRFASIVDMPSATLKSGAHRRTVLNRNLLVRRYPFVNGVKTGHTGKAGYVLVGSAERGGARVISAVLGEPSEAARDSDSLALLDWGLGQFHSVTPVKAGAELARAKIRWRGDDTVPLSSPRAGVLTVRRGKPVTTRIEAPRTVEGPLPAGRRVGSVKLIYRGRVLRTLPLVTAKAVPEAGFARKLASSLGGALLAVALLALAGLAALLLLRRSRSGRPQGRGSDDHHRHAQRRDRQDPGGSELPPRPPPPRRRADVDGGRQGRQRR
jgi:D-alanyl-D-alanine carboxypeptidase (penicillin-binding protein 5/6)